MKKCCAKYFLTLFLLACTSCTQRESSAPVEIVWNENKAVEIILSNSSILDLSDEELQSTLKAELGDTGESMLGQFFKRDGLVVFQPVIPFTRGMHYHVMANDIILAEVDIPFDASASIPKLFIYPSTDTVPENILKMYLRFSEPMVEGKSLRYIHLLNEKGDTLKGTFLDLQPELWNTGGTMLTLWFDPGRVKRDLIPNQEQGIPILKNERYTLVIDGDWKSKSGKEMGKAFVKNFSVKERDEMIPGIDSWLLQTPKSNTQDKLIINFLQQLDYSLIQSSIQIKNQHGNLIDGDFTVMENERGIQFIPKEKWKKNTYTLEVETKLEDLAGNNLLRPFDRDITKVSAPTEAKYVQRKFEIQ